MMTVHEILEKARIAGQRLPYNEAAVLFAATVRLAAETDSTIRPRLIRIDDNGGLRLEPLDEEAPEADPAYLAPELLSHDAPDKNDLKVQVYAAGVLGYELLTGKLAPPSGHPVGPELSGPLGDVVRLALAPDRRTRIEDLKQLEEAVEAVQPRPPAEGERNILAALRNRFSRPPEKDAALTRLVDRVHQLETQVATLGKAQARMEAAQRQSLETIERFEVGQLRAGDAGRRPRPVIAPAVVGGALAAVAVVAVAWAFGLFALPGVVKPAAAPVASESPPPEVKEAPETKPAPNEPKSAQAEKPAPSEPKAAVEAKPANEASSAQSEPAAPAEAKSAQVDGGESGADAGASAAADAGEADAATQAAATPAAPAPAGKKRASGASSQAAMLHALALSQVRRGEAALEQGNPDEALASFRAALENEPTIAVAFRGLGMAYAMQGHDAEALQAYDKYLRLSPKAPDAPEIRQSIRELRTRAKVGTTQD
jgi:tetratricopeptide (TPR) repeat protein